MELPTIYRLIMQKTYQNLIKELVDLGYLKTPAIISAFEKIDRKDFVLERDSDLAYINQPLSIGFNQTISQPLTVAFMLELLDPREGDKVLEIGSGSGWLSSLLAEITKKKDGALAEEGRNPNIVSIEIIQELHEMAKNNSEKYGFVGGGNILFLLQDGSKGYEEAAPYDKIIASASAGEIPQAWKDQLKIGGKIVCPVESSIIVLEKKSKNDFEEKNFFGFSFVPLVA